MTSAERAKRLGAVSRDDLVGQLFAGMQKEPIQDICGLANTPRLLKLALRNTFRAWERLHGELDFDDLLVANILRFAAPESFDFLLSHSGEVRALEADSAFNNREERLKAIEIKWTAATTAAAWDTTCAKRLVQFLFPCWHDRNYSRKAPSLQGVQVADPTDYWSRLNDGEIEASVIRDQELLRGLNRWKQDEHGKHFRNLSLIDILGTQEDFAKRFEYFASKLLDGHEIRKIASGLFAAALATHGSKASDDLMPGFIPLWRLAIRRPIEEREHVTWVQHEIFTALPISLRFANSIYYYWSANSESDIHRKEHRADLRAAIVDHAQKVYSGNPQAFTRAVDRSYIYSSYHFVVHFSSPEQGGAGFSAANWKWFASLLMDAAEVNAQVIVPQLVCFLVDEQHMIEGFRYTFNYAFTSEFFGNHIPRLMAVLAQAIDLTGYDVRESKRLQVARDEAVSWLNDHMIEPQQPPPPYSSPAAGSESGEA
jgi:hypothetical protein